jgi:hypothetical protein
MVLTLALLALAAAPPVQMPDACDHIVRNVWDPRFTPGQRWSYRSRPVDIGSTLIITHIDDVPGIGVVIHIDVDKLNFYAVAPAPHSSFGNRVEHMVIRRDSLDTSALDMLGIVMLGDDSGAYRDWQENCLGLTYSTTVADTIATLQAQYCAKTRHTPACTAPAAIPKKASPSGSPSPPASTPSSPTPAIPGTAPAKDPKPPSVPPSTSSP